MAFRKCDDCGNVFWGDTELKYCPLCAVVEKAETKRVELHKKSNERQVQPAAA